MVLDKTKSTFFLSNDIPWVSMIKSPCSPALASQHRCEFHHRCLVGATVGNVFAKTSGCGVSVYGYISILSNILLHWYWHYKIWWNIIFTFDQCKNHILTSSTGTDACLCFQPLHKICCKSRPCLKVPVVTMHEQLRSQGQHAGFIGQWLYLHV